jgi:hypothetical protein
MKTRNMLRIIPLIAVMVALATSGSAMASHTGGGGGGHSGGAHASGSHFGGGGYRGWHGRGGWGGWGGWRGGYCCGWGWGWLGYGLFLGALPWYYSTYWWDGVPYYYADDAYYLWNGNVGQYEQVPPPAGLVDQAQQAPSLTELFMYPKGGQSADQQARDRYECHRWAADQTGFDPTQAAGGVAANAAVAKREEYRRAEAACLEGRNYSVK